MRTIKFRGKSINSGEWVYGDLFQCEDNMYILPDDYCPDFEVIPETVGQFTGLFDKDGAEIYEHDQVLRNGEVYIITYNHLHACWGLWTKSGQSSEEILCDICDSEGNTPKQWTESTLKVIGNIHDKTSDQ